MVIMSDFLLGAILALCYADGGWDIEDEDVLAGVLVDYGGGFSWD